MLRKFGPFCGALLVFLVVFLLVENYAAPSFQNCVSQNSSAQSAKEAKNKGHIIGRFILAELICSLRLVDRHNGFFAAVAAFVIAAFTFTLWQSTEKLWRASEDQLEDAGNEAGRARFNRIAEEARLNEQINIARQSAEAAKQAADAAVAAERARFYVIIDHNFLECINRAAAWDGPIDQEERQLPMDAQPMAGIKFKNYGKTPGFVDNVSTGLRYSETIPIPVFDEKVSWRISLLQAIVLRNSGHSFRKC